ACAWAGTSAAARADVESLCTAVSIDRRQAALVLGPGSPASAKVASRTAQLGLHRHRRKFPAHLRVVHNPGDNSGFLWLTLVHPVAIGMVDSTGSRCSHVTPMTSDQRTATLWRWPRSGAPTPGL